MTLNANNQNERQAKSFALQVPSRYVCVVSGINFTACNLLPFGATVKKQRPCGSFTGML